MKEAPLLYGVGALLIALVSWVCPVYLFYSREFAFCLPPYGEILESLMAQIFYKIIDIGVVPSYPYHGATMGFTSAEMVSSGFYRLEPISFFITLLQIAFHEEFVDFIGEPHKW